ncbi:T9SS type A sorting domain-containing protein [candidate division KSB1 bacterium]|nr:T9SS type A sorting domain-containing protein [candidate division KSB1 bacterium]RQW06041.1 MAG: T9SS C-terminal target domain-containing protein [candidate division KSB1 bacterium]
MRAFAADAVVVAVALCALFPRAAISQSETKLFAFDGAAEDRFGGAVSMSGDDMAVGAPWDDDKGSGSGAVCVYKNQYGTHVCLIAKVAASDGAFGDGFGSSLCIKDDLLIIGAPYDDDRGECSGAAYIFKRDGSKWLQKAKLGDSAGQQTSRFGYSVSIDGRYCAVGAYFKNTVYLFKNNDTTWTEEAKFKASDQPSPCCFGYRVANHINRVLVGAIYTGHYGVDTGAAYLYQFDSPTILAIQDVPYDQGGHVTLTWHASCLDDGRDSLSHYSIWRAIDENLSKCIPASIGETRKDHPPPTVRSALFNGQTYTWEWLADQSIHCYSHYTYAAPTLYDSISTSQTDYTDTNVTPGHTYFYALAAVDVHENESDLSEVVFSTPVPVELECFTASVERQTVHLTWRTASESNNYGFEIERCDGDHREREWQKIGFVAGYGTSSESHDYFFEDILTPAQTARFSTFNYRLKQIDADGSFSHSEVVAVTLELPKTFSLAQNCPNPFNARTTLQFAMPHRSLVKLAVYDLMGREVAVLMNEEVGAGVHCVTFDSGDVGSGLYYYRFESSEFTQMRKLLVIK